MPRSKVPQAPDRFSASSREWGAQVRDAFSVLNQEATARRWNGVRSLRECGRPSALPFRALRDRSLRLLDARAGTDAGLAARASVGRGLLLDGYRSSLVVDGDVAALSRIEPSVEVPSGPSQLVRSGSRAGVATVYVPRSDCGSAALSPGSDKRSYSAEADTADRAGWHSRGKSRSGRRQSRAAARTSQSRIDRKRWVGRCGRPSRRAAAVASSAERPRPRRCYVRLPAAVERVAAALWARGLTGSLSECRRASGPRAARCRRYSCECSHARSLPESGSAGRCRGCRCIPRLANR